MLTQTQHFHYDSSWFRLQCTSVIHTKLVSPTKSEVKVMLANRLTTTVSDQLQWKAKNQTKKLLKNLKEFLELKKRASRRFSLIFGDPLTVCGRPARHKHRKQFPATSDLPRLRWFRSFQNLVLSQMFWVVLSQNFWRPVVVVYANVYAKGVSVGHCPRIIRSKVILSTVCLVPFCGL